MIFEGTKNQFFFGLELTRAGKARPNIKAMKNIKAYCEKNNLPYVDVEEAWLNYKVGGTL